MRDVIFGIAIALAMFVVLHNYTFGADCPPGYTSDVTGECYFKPNRPVYDPANRCPPGYEADAGQCIQKYNTAGWISEEEFNQRRQCKARYTDETGYLEVHNIRMDNNAYFRYLLLYYDGLDFIVEDFQQ